VDWGREPRRRAIDEGKELGEIRSGTRMPFIGFARAGEGARVRVRRQKGKEMPVARGGGGRLLGLGSLTHKPSGSSGSSLLLTSAVL
jgi:hypothetical protein